jgi:hypothetical protein
MRWCVIHNPDVAGLPVIAEDALDHYRNHGWRRVSDWATNGDDLRAALARGDTELSDGLADLDAPEPAPAKKAPAKQEKENS